MRKISKDEVRVGDYAYIDGYSSFCDGYKDRITAIKTRYDEKTGESYEVIVCGEDEYRKDDGSTIKGATAYSIFGYYREDETEKDIKDNLKRLRQKRSRLVKKLQRQIEVAINEINAESGESIQVRESHYSTQDFDLRISTQYDKEIDELEDKLSKLMY